MNEIFQESIRLINFPFTVLLGLLALYWLGVIFGVLEVDLLDFGLDLDADAEAPGMFGRLFLFLGAVDTPIFVVFSVLGLCMWTFSMIANHYFNPNDSLMLGLLFLIPNLSLGLILTRHLVLPFHSLFRAMSHDEEAKVELIGKICVVISGEVTAEFGQAEIRISASPITINARVGANQPALKKGDEAVVVSKNEDGSYRVKTMED